VQQNPVALRTNAKCMLQAEELQVGFAKYIKMQSPTIKATTTQQSAMKCRNKACGFTLCIVNFSRYILCIYTGNG